VPLCCTSARSRRLRPLFFFLNHPATTEIHTLSLHDALPIFSFPHIRVLKRSKAVKIRDRVILENMLKSSQCQSVHSESIELVLRSEEHTSELQSRENLVCRLLLEKKKTTNKVSHRVIYETRV